MMDGTDSKAMALWKLWSDQEFGYKQAYEEGARSNVVRHMIRVAQAKRQWAYQRVMEERAARRAAR